MKPVMRWLPSQLVTAHPESAGDGTAVTGGGALHKVIASEGCSVPILSPGGFCPPSLSQAWGWLKGAAWVPSPALPLASLVISGEGLLSLFPRL